MSDKRLDARSLLLGLAAGAGAVLAGNAFFARHPERTLAQRLVNRALERTYRAIRAENPIRLGAAHRYVIFSDHHKGARNKADDFRQCEQTYLDALGHYDERGFTLVVLGDAEEMLEEPIPAVLDSYPAVLRKEADFHPERLIRVYGNHDIVWHRKELVEQYMQPFFPGVVYREGVVFQLMDGDNRPAGEIFLVHGYQGTLDSDVLAFLAPMVLPYYRDFQNLTGLGGTSPSRDACLRSKQDNQLYRWVSQQEKLILIAGHTHRPVWSSKTHLDKLTEELYALLRLPVDQRPGNYQQLVAAKQAEIAERQEKYPPCDDMVKTKPAYFNAGCCRYKDGDITGIELEDGVLRLIKWGKGAGQAQRTVLEENLLAELFLYL